MAKVGEFRNFYDAYGHRAADHVRREVAELTAGRTVMAAAANSIVAGVVAKCSPSAQSPSDTHTGVTAAFWDRLVPPRRDCCRKGRGAAVFRLRYVVVRDVLRIPHRLVDNRLDFAVRDKATDVDVACLTNDAARDRPADGA